MTNSPPRKSFWTRFMTWMRAGTKETPLPIPAPDVSIQMQGLKTSHWHSHALTDEQMKALIGNGAAVSWNYIQQTLKPQEPQTKDQEDAIKRQLQSDWSNSVYGTPNPYQPQTPWRSPENFPNPHTGQSTGRYATPEERQSIYKDCHLWREDDYRRVGDYILRLESLVHKLDTMLNDEHRVMTDGQIEYHDALLHAAKSDIPVGNVMVKSERQRYFDRSLVTQPRKDKPGA